MMVFEELGECPPGTSIVDRLAFLAGCSCSLKAEGPIPESAFDSVISKMNRQFGSPIIDAHSAIIQIQSVNQRLHHLDRELPRIVQCGKIQD